MSDEKPKTKPEQRPQEPRRAPSAGFRPAIVALNEWLEGRRNDIGLSKWLEGK
jgi:hypothetical protein